MVGMAKPSESQPVPPPARAQMLATEHSGLLAARGAAQSEMLTRITIFLTMVSAGLVSLALVAQATKFTGYFGAFAIAVFALVVVVGLLTQIRVQLVAIEDLMYVLALNRIRAAYVAIDPGVAPYLLASPYDDQAGSQRTYDFLGRRPDVTHIGGSSMVLIITANGALLGLLAATIASALGAQAWQLFVVAIVVALTFVVTSVVRGERRYRRVWTHYVPLNPTPAQ